MEGDGLRRAHIKMGHSCSLLRHGTMDWLCSAYTKVKIFSTYWRSEILTNSRPKCTDLILAETKPKNLKLYQM